MTAKTYGAPDDYIAKRKLFDQALYDAIISAPSDAVALDRAKAIVAKGVADKVIDSNEAGTLPQDDARPWERYFLAYQASTNVGQAEDPGLGAERITGCAGAGKGKSCRCSRSLKGQMQSYRDGVAGMNHLLQDAKTGSPNEYNDIEQTISPTALKIICDWVSTQTRPRVKAD